MCSCQRTYILILAAISAGLSSLWGQAPPGIEAKLRSHHIVVGEKVLLSVEVSGATVIDWPKAPSVSQLSISQHGRSNTVSRGYIKESYEYLVTALRPGLYRIPSFELATAKGTLKSQPMNLRVFEISNLITKGITIQRTVTPYLSGVFVEDTNPFLGETQKVEAKLYVAQQPPHLLRLRNGSVIDMEKDGIAAWRFTADPAASGLLEHDGIRFAVYTYQSSISALRVGPLKIGPGKVEPFFQRRVSYRGGFANQTESYPIEFPACSIEVRPLPDGAPPGFQGAVGNFSLHISAITRAIEMGGTLTVEASVEGEGNIGQFPGPQLVDLDGDWKQFEMIAKPAGEERRSSSGTVEFSQVVRPLQKVANLPSYRLVFFDPVLERYQTLESPAQPITITGDLSLINDFPDSSLPFLTPGNTGLVNFTRESSFPSWLWHLIPAAFVAFLGSHMLKNHLARRSLGTQPGKTFHQELEKVAGIDDDRVRFYREASKFATQWEASNGFDEIFETRDEICFLPESKPEPVARKEKERVLKLLKSLAPILLGGLFIVLQTGNAHALSNDPAKAREEILSVMDSEPAKEHFYNLALCEKLLGNPGRSALWAYRFEAQGGDAGNILNELPGVRPIEHEGTDWVSLVPRLWFLNAAMLGGWSLVIVVVALKAPLGKLRRFSLISASVSAAFFLPLGAGGLFLYPDEISFEPLHQLAVISQSSPLRSQPFEGGRIMRKDLVGSLCKIKARRSGWTRIELPGGLAGWVADDTVETVAP